MCPILSTQRMLWAMLFSFNLSTITKTLNEKPVCVAICLNSVGLFRLYRLLISCQHQVSLVDWIMAISQFLRKSQLLTMKTIERMRTEKDANIFSNTFWNDQNAIDSSANQQQGEKEDSQSIRYWTICWRLTSWWFFTLSRKSKRHVQRSVFWSN